MKGRKGRAGLKGQLVEKSVDAYVLALETINRLSIKYRVECFTYLICNSWELLLKARILDLERNREAIYYRNDDDQRRSLSLRDALKKVIASEKDPVRRNLEKVATLRDDAMHFVISEIPRDVLLLFQACVINYHKKLDEWFCISLSDRVSVGMMTIVYDLSPSTADLSSAAYKRRIGKDVVKYLAGTQADIQREFKELGESSEYSIGVEYKLVLTKKPGEADIVLNSGSEGSAGAVVHVAKDPSLTHPHRQKDVVIEINKALKGNAEINPHDVQCINKVFNVKKRAEWFYQGKVVSSPAQYSREFVNWVVERFKQDANFFADTREKFKR